jgi:sulfotransferase
MKQFVCLSGLPRTGSTLLSAILCQNPKIHAEGNSALCQIMWDTQQSCLTSAKEQLAANNRSHTMYDIITKLPELYYKDIEESIIVDKCRSWTLKANVEMLKNYITKDFKIIVMERPIIEIVKSFAKLYRSNNSGIISTNFEEKLVEPGSEPIMRSLEGIHWAKQNNQNNNFLFISYDELVNNTEITIKKIYDFCEWEYFHHDFTNIVVKYPENDEIYKLHGHHEIRPTIKKIENNVVLSKELEAYCLMIDKVMGYGI